MTSSLSDKKMFRTTMRADLFFTLALLNQHVATTSTRWSWIPISRTSLLLELDHWSQTILGAERGEKELRGVDRCSE